MRKIIESKRLSSGIEGLDKILNGGFIKNRTYLIMGGPGTGKTTLGLHFLDQGLKNNEKTMFINLEEAKEELILDAKNFNFEIDDMYILDLTPKKST
ncbi:MAG: ATPase domain-containing protein [Halanaerobiales bacterium]|nr:ATPase domain-containing protein [Halanaerobiales bacterium]